MEKDEDYRIEKIGTPAGDAASANSVVKAINYILLKLKELDDYYTDKLKFLDISSLDPILEDIHNQINELKTNQELINQKLSKIVIEDEKTASESIEPKFALKSEESDILESPEVEKSPQNMELSDLQGLKFKEILSTLTELQTKKDLEIQNQLSKFYSILHDEDISGSLESLGGYIDQKNTLGVIFNFLTLPDSEIPKNYNVMLYGPEGNGKTSLIYALAKKYGYSLIIPDFSILSTYSVDKRSREIISMFKNILENHEIKPSILFLD
ncbi:MAG: AAA family ATPase, partial [Candidatus Helarchaeota archaeon]